MQSREIKVGDRVTIVGLEADLFVMSHEDNEATVSCWYWPPSCEEEFGAVIRVSVSVLTIQEEFCASSALRNLGSALTIRGTDDGPIFILNAVAEKPDDPTSNIEVIWKVDGMLKKVFLPQCVFEPYFENHD